MTTTHRRSHRRSHRLVGRVLVAVALVAGLAVGSSPAGADDPPEGGPANWRQVSSGSSHSCGIRTTGRLYCWGFDGWSQLGDGGPDTDQSLPVEVFGGGSDWVTVSAGGVHTCAIKTNGRLYCWGGDSQGEVGDGAPEVNQAIPVEVVGGLTDWTAVSSGGHNTCALRSTGRLYCWGRDLWGQVGDGGGTANQPAPVLVAGAATNWTSVSVGAVHTCARRATGRLYCWGDDSQGELGDGGPNQNRRAPVRVALGFTDWSSVTAGELSTCGLRAGGVLYCWGSDDNGRLGNGGLPVDRRTPARVAGRAVRWGAVWAGSAVCARRTTGRLYCWGPDGDGQLGDGGANADRPVPTLVAGRGTNWALAFPGYRHTCGRRTSGRVFCWGGDFAGQLGNGGANTARSTPGRVL